MTALLGWPASDRDGLAPEAFFDALRGEGRRDEAALFLGQALPRYEGVAWAARAVRDVAPEAADGDAEALKAALLWLQDPSETRRRAAFEAAGRAGDHSPQRLCALAAFFSGGSMAPDNVQPVPAPKEAAGKFAAVAVLAAASASGRREAALDQAFELGDRLACGGAKA